MLEKIQLTNYRNLDLGEGLTFKPLTVFVGANGSGKTNLIKVLRFLQDAWVKQPDEIRGITRFENAVANWGAGKILDKRLSLPATVTINVDFRFQEGFHHLFHTNLTVKDENSVSLRDESLHRWEREVFHDENKWYYQAGIAEDQSAVFRDLSVQNTNSEPSFYQIKHLPANELATHSIHDWLTQNREINAKPLSFYQGKRLMEEFLGDWAFYESAQMNLEKIRKANPEVGSRDRILKSSGENLALVLYNLDRADLDFRDILLQSMKQLFPRTHSLRPYLLGRTALTLEWVQHGINKPFFLDDMSDGTIRMLCWATILRSPQKPKLIVIDEPEANIHPAWLRVLAGWIHHASRETQVIISTHSSDLLDYFTDDLESVRVFQSNPEAPSYSVIKEINRQEIQPRLDEGWQLGDLYRVGDPSVGGWP